MSTRVTGFPILQRRIEGRGERGEDRLVDCSILRSTRDSRTAVDGRNVATFGLCCEELFDGRPYLAGVGTIGSGWRDFGEPLVIMAGGVVLRGGSWGVGGAFYPSNSPMISPLGCCSRRWCRGERVLHTNGMCSSMIVNLVTMAEHTDRGGLPGGNRARTTPPSTRCCT